MKSRFCSTFVNARSYHFHRKLRPSQIERNITFSVEFWQPFISIDVAKTDVSSMICGPLLGFVIELCQSLNSNLVFLPHTGNKTLPVKDLSDGKIHLVLTPFAATSIFEDNLDQYVHLSRVLDDIPMISILSGKSNSVFNYDSLKLLNHPFIFYWGLSFLLLNILVCIVSRHWRGNHRCCCRTSNMILWILGSSLRQPAPRFNRHQKIRPLMVNLLWLNFFLNIFLSNLLLTFYTFGEEPGDIDTIQDLAATSDMKIFVFQDETAETLFSNPEYPFHENFKDRLIIEDPRNEFMELFENSMAERMDRRKLAMVSDKYYLDYFFNTHSPRYRNLYRSIKHDTVMPYFLPVSNQVSPELNWSINNLILLMVENGIYGYWVRETLDMNRHPDEISGKQDSNNEQQREDGYHSLHVEDIKGVFYNTLLYDSIAVLVLIAEIFYSRFRFKMRKIKIFS